jgi:alkylation response protein AidB-like acyl-CoA dehydrogenase
VEPTVSATVDLSPIQRRVASSAAAQELSAYLDEHLPAFHDKWGTDRCYDARMEWQRTLAAGGWAAPGWPVEYGGRGLGVADRVACDLLLGERKAPPLAGVLGVNNVGPTLMAWGSDEQKASLPRILDGTELWCQGFSEPDAGSDLAGLRMSAVRDGADFVVNGEKLWTSQGLEATHCQLLVRTDPAASKHKGISALAVPLDLPGIERRPLKQITGDSDFAQMSFRDVRVPASCLLGPENSGWMVTMTTLAHERTGVIAVSAVLEAETAHLIADHQADGPAPLSAGLADELVQRYIESRVIAMMGENLLAEGDSDAAAAPGPGPSLIKLSWSQLSQALSSTRVAVAGYDGLSSETFGLGWQYLTARAATIAGGTTEVMKNVLAERFLGLPRDA